MHDPPLRICLVSEEYPPVAGGIGTYTSLLANGLAAAGHRVDVLTGAGGEPAPDPEGRILHHVVTTERSRLPRRLRTRLTRTIETRAWAAGVARTVSRLPPDPPVDVIECPEFRAQAARLVRSSPIPVLVKLHTPTYLCDQLNGATSGVTVWDDRLAERDERRAARRATLVTSPSAALASAVGRRWGLDDSRVRVVPNPLDAQFGAPAVPRDGDLVLYVGRLERRKGVDVLAEAMVEVWRSHPGARVRFVGHDQPSGIAGVSMADALRATLAGGPADRRDAIDDAVGRSELPSVYAAAGIAVIPSRFENFPYTCLEAMASGCAVVASRTGGLAEIVEHEVDGLLVEPGSASALAASISRLLHSPALRERLAQAAQRSVRARFGSDAVATATVAVYREAIERRRARSSR